MIDQDTKGSHRAVTEAEIIPVDEGSSLFQSMNQIYQGVMNFILFEGDTRFCEKTKRGYVGYKTVASCPGHVAENPELNYSKKCKKGVVLLRTVVNIEKGSEITVKYGKSFLRQYRVQPVSLQQVSYIKAGRQGNVKTLNRNAVWQKLLSLLCKITNRIL